MFKSFSVLRHINCYLTKQSLRTNFNTYIRPFSKMQVVYAQDKQPDQFSKSIFLAGPTPRSPNVQSWRPEALEILKSLNYDGVVFTPEFKEKRPSEYINQIDWEQKCRNMSDIVVFWIPRNLETLPAFTTNVEFGEDYKSGKIIYGRPNDAPNCRYLDTLYNQQYYTKPENTLYDTLVKAIGNLNNGQVRSVGERCIPLNIWNTPQFQSWITSHKKVGNVLHDAKVLNTTYVVKGKYLFYFQILVNIWIESEKRYKKNEFFVSRTDISTIVGYYKPKDMKSINETKILLIKEFRSPVRNEHGFVFECPGGSTFKNNQDILQVASDELFEETGLKVPKDRFQYKTSKQICATVSSHYCHCFSVELNDDEWNYVEENAKSNKVFGADDNEKTYLVASSLQEIRENKNVSVDWSMTGIIYDAIL